jgi:hypothetical protein
MAVRTTATCDAWWPRPIAKSSWVNPRTRPTRGCLKTPRLNGCYVVAGIHLMIVDASLVQSRAVAVTQPKYRLYLPDLFERVHVGGRGISFPFFSLFFHVRLLYKGLLVPWHTD